MTGPGAIDECVQNTALDHDGNVINMNRNDNGQFNLDWNNRDNQNPDNGPRQKFLIKTAIIFGGFVLMIFASQLPSLIYRLLIWLEINKFFQ